MGVKITYICDKCGHVQDTEQQMWKLQVSLTHFSASLNYSTTKREGLWCRPCIEALGLLPIPGKTPPALPTPNLSLEDIVREIVTDCLTAAGR